MTGLEDIVQAAMAAPAERRDEALRLLQGHLPKAEPTVTLRGLSKSTGFGPSTLRRWQVPSVDIGGRRRYRISEVMAYFESEAFQRRLAALRAERREKRSNTQSQGRAK
jgi:hypothetical protein